MNRLELEAQIKADPFNPRLHIALARIYLEEGDEERARKIIVTKRKLPSKDGSVHFEWGKLCEELGLARQAVESYEQAIALNPDNPEYHFRIGLLYYEKGAWERALKHLHKTLSLSSNYEEAKEILASLYEEMGFKVIASNIKGAKKESISSLKTYTFSVRHEDLFMILYLFQGKEKGYARYRIGERGDLVHSFVDEVLGIEQLINHIKGEECIGVYPLRSDRTLRFCAIRVGIPWRRLLANIKNSGFLKILEDNIHQYANLIRIKAKQSGIVSYLEKPGDRERRVWFFFEEFILYDLGERFLNSILNSVESPGVDLSVNLLLGIKGAGIGIEDEPIMLPLGKNLRTGERCFFIDEDENPYEDQIGFLKKIRKIGLGEIKGFLKGSQIGTYLSSLSIESLNLLQRKCPVLEDIIHKARSGRNLQDEEKKVIFFTIGFLIDGEKMIHEILESCPEYRPNRVDKMLNRLGQNPISCPKIRQLMPERTAYLACNCLFKINEGEYPTPILHLDKDLRRSFKSDLQFKKGREENLYGRYTFICKKIEELKKEKERLEAMMGIMGER